jgi:hypothetical protein
MSAFAEHFSSMMYPLNSAAVAILDKLAAIANTTITLLIVFLHGIKPTLFHSMRR